jgi:four helix bundle protein
VIPPIVLVVVLVIVLVLPWLFTSHLQKSSTSTIEENQFTQKNVHAVGESPAQHRRELIEQRDRASLSMLLNTAEGNSKRHGRHRAKFFADARDSAFECAACLDASVPKRLVLADRIQPGKEMLARVVAMLTRLIDRFDTDEPLIRKD